MTASEKFLSLVNQIKNETFKGSDTDTFFDDPKVLHEMIVDYLIQNKIPELLAKHVVYGPVGSLIDQGLGLTDYYQYYAIDSAIKLLDSLKHGDPFFIGLRHPNFLDFHNHFEKLDVDCSPYDDILCLYKAKPFNGILGVSTYNNTLESIKDGEIGYCGLMFEKWADGVGAYFDLINPNNLYMFGATDISIPDNGLGGLRLKNYFQILVEVDETTIDIDFSNLALTL